MSSGPRILLTNDDGIDAPGLEVLRGIAAELSDDVWVVAPQTNQSGAGHRFTLGRELSWEARGEREFAIAGSPADCVAAGCSHFVSGKAPDLVLSGINNGQNLGDIIHCSGTLAGAREGALQGALGIALSQGVDYENELPVAWDNAAAWGAKIVRALFEKEARGRAYFNINFPYCPPGEVAGVALVPHQRFERAAFRYYQSHNAERFFVAIPETPGPIDPGKDFHAILNGNTVAVTPLRLDQSDTEEIARLSDSLRF